MRNRHPHHALLPLAAAAFALAAKPALAPQPGLAAQGFGGSVVISQGQVLIGEPSNVQLPGVVYVYGRNAQGWSETARLTLSPVTAPPDGFGGAVALDGGVAVVSAPGEDDGAGAVYVFTRTETPGPSAAGSSRTKEVVASEAGSPSTAPRYW